MYKKTLFAIILTLCVQGCGYNGMVSGREEVQASWSQVENQLQRRNDLIPNLVEVTKGYATHEKAVFEDIAKARSALLSSGNKETAMDASNSLSSAIGRLLILKENYPDLKANEQFSRLSDEIAGTENRIAVERTRYNNTVRSYNTNIASFPQNMMASMFGFKTETYFKAPDAAKQAPTVKF